ncbi:MAG: DUF4058 family protein [Leptolyngbyaceae cyanobacterium CSU_1_3]|nr:DUF4058 family protein [Leptolyngbyaceae cyanobacterium CSU_1_3]
MYIDLGAEKIIAGKPVINLRAFFDRVDEQAGYEVVMDYSRDPVPSLSERSTIWMQGLLQDKGLRRIRE